MTALRQKRRNFFLRLENNLVFIFILKFRNLFVDLDNKPCKAFNSLA